jgi:hypothetical protein
VQFRPYVRDAHATKMHRTVLVENLKEHDHLKRLGRRWKNDSKMVVKKIQCEAVERGNEPTSFWCFGNGLEGNQLVKKR